MPKAKAKPTAEAVAPPPVPEEQPPPGRRQRLHRGRTIEERRAERRTALLGAALELFGTKGYALTSIEELCSTSFVTTRYFYEEFVNREGLLLALYDQVVEQVVAAVLAVEVPPGEDRIERATRARVAAFVHATIDDERAGRVLLLEQGGGSAALESRRRATHTFFARFVASKSFNYLEAGAVLPHDYDLLGLFFVGAVNEALCDWIVSPPEERRDIEHVIDAITEMHMLVRRGLER